MIGPLTYLDVALHRGRLHFRPACDVSRLCARTAVDRVVDRRRRRRLLDLRLHQERHDRRDRGSDELPPQVAIAQIAIGARRCADRADHRALITARISDAILDSRVGMIDRILGFVFGVLRGFLLIVSSPTWSYEVLYLARQGQAVPLDRDAMLSRDYVKATGQSIRIGAAAGHTAAPASRHHARPTNPASNRVS